MRDQLAVLVLRILALTPIRFNQWLGRQIARIAWRQSAKLRHITLTNLTLCFPDKTEAEKKRLGKRSTEAMAEALMESPRLWKLPIDKLEKLCVNPESFYEIKQAFDQGNGLIIAVPHIGSWEFVGLYLGMHFPTTSLYRPPRMKSIDRLMHSGRSHTGATLVPTAASGIKLLTKALRNHECIGLLPDQEATDGNGVFADFFNVPAYTMHLLPRMAQRKNSPVFFVNAERTGEGKFRFHVIKSDNLIYDRDTEIACRSMNKSVEKLVSACPQQYNWNYKRFSLTPDGTNNY